MQPVESTDVGVNVRRRDGKWSRVPTLFEKRRRRKKREERRKTGRKEGGAKKAKVKSCHSCTEYKAGRQLLCA